MPDRRALIWLNPRGTPLSVCLRSNSGVQDGERHAPALVRWKGWAQWSANCRRRQDYARSDRDGARSCPCARLPGHQDACQAVATGQTSRGAVLPFRCQPACPWIDKMDGTTGNTPYRDKARPAIGRNYISFRIALNLHARSRAPEEKSLRHGLCRTSANQPDIDIYTHARRWT